MSTNTAKFLTTPPAYTDCEYDGSSTGGRSSSSGQPMSSQPNQIHPHRADLSCTSQIQSSRRKPGSPSPLFYMPSVGTLESRSKRRSLTIGKFLSRFTFRHTSSSDCLNVRCARRHPGRPVLQAHKRWTHSRSIQRPFQLLHRTTRRSVITHSIYSAAPSRPIPGHLSVPFRSL